MKYSELEIVAYLASHAPLESFYIYRPSNDGDGLIKFHDENGDSWSLMEDDSDMVSAATMALMAKNAPLITTLDSLASFERHVKATAADQGRA